MLLLAFATIAEGRAIIAGMLGCAVSLWVWSAWGGWFCTITLLVTSICMRLTARGGSASKVLSQSALRGKVAIVTGANAGIGYYTALGLARMGCRVVLLCRTSIKADEAARAMRRSTPTENLFLDTAFTADFSDLSAVRRCAEKYLASGLPLHILVNNAGVSMVGLQFTERQPNLEYHTVVNAMAPMLLTEMLMPRIRASCGRVVHVASEAHRLFTPPEGVSLLDTIVGINRGAGALSGPLGVAKSRFALQHYGMSKMLNIHYAHYVATVHHVPTCSLHPGSVVTTLADNTLPMWSVLKHFLYVILKTGNEGAHTTLHCCACHVDELRPRTIHSDTLAPYFADCEDHTAWLSKAGKNIREGSEAIKWCLTVIKSQQSA